MAGVERFREAYWLGLEIELLGMFEGSLVVFGFLRRLISFSSKRAGHLV